MTIEPLRSAVRDEALRLLSWWVDHLPDAADGFWGEIDAKGQPVREAPKGAILNTRLLWFFSAMATYLKSDEALELARRAARYIRDRFLDSEQGGLYWLLDHTGAVMDAKKQAYAQAFAVYAFAEYYRATQDEEALTLARELQSLIEVRFWDATHSGYIEALNHDWQGLADQRLSDKDLDAPKTMNTHLHILEAYTNLHRVAPDTATRVGLCRALDIFMDHFVDADSHHLRLFYDMDWTDRTAAVSYGHDIEASWLIWEAAVALDDPDRLARVRSVTLNLAQAALHEGINADGGLSYERSFTGHLDSNGEWWGQAEGLVGFVNAWQLSGEDAYLEAATRLWPYIQVQFGAGGDQEWTWYAANAGRDAMYKAGMWKCPYHNGRAMMELDHRLKR